MSEKRFLAYATSLEEYVESMENRNTKEKTMRDVQLFDGSIFEIARRLRSTHDCASRIEKVPR